MTAVEPVPPRLVGVERCALALALALAVSGFAARPLAERGDPALAADLRAHYDGPVPVRDDFVRLVPHASEHVLGSNCDTHGRWPTPPLDDPWGEPWGPTFMNPMGCPGTTVMTSAGPDRRSSTLDDVQVRVTDWLRCPLEPIVCARSALLALSALVLLLVVAARVLPRPRAVWWEAGLALPAAAAAAWALGPVACAWEEALPCRMEVRAYLATRPVCIDEGDAVTGAVAIAALVAVLALRLGRRGMNAAV